MSVESEHAIATKVVDHLRPLLLSSSANVLVTHGNGPQVGHMLARVEAGRKSSYTLPLDACVATTEGELGDVLAGALREALEGTRPVAALLTHVKVDGTSTAFRKPTKPVGPFLTEARAKALKEQGMTVAPDPAGRGYRRVVASPEPLEVLDVEVIRRLLDTGTIVVAGGGGGIPVVREEKQWRGVEAVVDKDLTAALLADAVDADLFVIVTDVPAAYTEFGTSHRAPVGRCTVGKLRELLVEGHFTPGSMAPKVEACVRFVSRPGRRATICDPSTLEQALAGEAGTQVTYD